MQSLASIESKFGGQLSPRVHDLCMTIVAALRPNSDEDVTTTCTALLLEILPEFHNDFVKFHRGIERSPVEEIDVRKPQGSRPSMRLARSSQSLFNTQAEDVVRFFFFVSRLSSLGYRVRQMLIEVSDVFEIASNRNHHAIGGFRQVYRTAIQVVILQIQWILESPIFRPSSLLSSFMIKSFLTNQIIVQLILFLTYQYAGANILIGYLPVIPAVYLVSSVPSFGDVLLRAGRRFSGLLIATGVAAILFVVGPTSATIFLILIIIVFGGKLNTFNPSIGDAAREFINAFIYGVMPLYDSSDGGDFGDENSAFILRSVYRGSCVAIGFIYALTCAFLVYPQFDSTTYRQKFAKTVNDTSRLFCDTLGAAINIYRRSGDANSVLSKIENVTPKILSIEDMYKSLTPIKKSAVAKVHLLGKLNLIRKRAVGIEALTHADIALSNFAEMSFTFYQTVYQICLIN